MGEVSVFRMSQMGVSENGVYMVYQQLVNVFQRQHDELWDLHMDLL